MTTYLEWISSILNAGVIVTVAIYIIQTIKERNDKKKETKDRLIRVCNALKVEVDKLNDWYDSKEYEELKIRGYIPEFTQKIEYSENIINKAPYDGIVNSGLITYLEKETQSKLNTYYFYVDLHNKRMFNLAQIYNDRGSSPEFSDKDVPSLLKSLAWKSNISELTKYEVEMKKMVPELKKLLDDEIEKAES